MTRASWTGVLLGVFATFGQAAEATTNYPFRIREDAPVLSMTLHGIALQFHDAFATFLHRQPFRDIRQKEFFIDAMVLEHVDKFLLQGVTADDLARFDIYQELRLEVRKLLRESFAEKASRILVPSPGLQKAFGAYRDEQARIPLDLVVNFLRDNTLPENFEINKVDPMTTGKLIWLIIREMNPCGRVFSHS